MRIAHVPGLATLTSPTAPVAHAPGVPSPNALMPTSSSADGVFTPVVAAPGDPTPPAAEYYNKHGMSYLRIPGVKSVGWGLTSAPGVYDQFLVNVADDRAAAVLVGLLEPVVDGIKVKIRVGGDDYFGSTEAPFRDRVATVAAMTGVWDYKYLVGPNGGRVTFNVVNQGMIDKLDPLLRRDIPAWVNKAGKQTYLRIFWKAGVPA